MLLERLMLLLLLRIMMVMMTVTTVTVMDMLDVVVLSGGVGSMKKTEKILLTTRSCQTKFRVDPRSFKTGWQTLLEEEFAAFFSGQQQISGGKLESWCTPYALSIMGQPMVRNCPFGNGNGYGDGRAVSVGEVVVKGQRWEMQLKGGGQTPFCRGADGRAVLRSSIREFLASEAMYHLGVDTTRALSLVVSDGGEMAERPWYSSQNRDSDPDMMIHEPCAITTRVAPSFLREHELIVEHALFREYPDCLPGSPLPARAAAMLREAAKRFSVLTLGIRKSGNFNADNCLVGGRTMDYGRFACSSIGVAHMNKHLTLNQPEAGLANFMTLAIAMKPLLGKDAPSILQEIAEAAQEETRTALRRSLVRITGLKSAAELNGSLATCGEFVPSSGRWAVVTMDGDKALKPENLEFISSGEALFATVSRAFYDAPKPDVRVQWLVWLRRLRSALAAEGGTAAAAQRIRATNPKYIPREWMLVQAYDAAAKGDYGLTHELHRLFLKPYDEQPEFHDKYFCCTPPCYRGKGGVEIMT
eukprot:s3510_g3.t1